MTRQPFRTLAAVIVCVVSIASTVHAQSPATTTAVTEYVKAEMQRQHIPGLSLLVAKAGKIIRAEGFGMANVELQVPVKPETIFQSGSVGKQFTATAVMMLVEEGKVGLDDPLTKYFADAPPTWKDVTVRELLSHTAGFGDYPKDFNYRKDWTEDEELKLVESIPLAYPPGTSWEYSNLGYVTLGILIHRVTGEFYGDFLQQRIFLPLGHDDHPHHQRGRHHPQSLCRIPSREGRIEESGVGRTLIEYHRGRQPLLLDSGPREVGRRALHRKTPEAFEPRPDVDSSEVEEWPAQ